MKWLTVSIIIVLLHLANISQVHAGAVLHIGNPPNSGSYLYGSEIRPISDTSLGILENGNGQPTLDNPLLLILGVPNKVDGTFTAPSITLSAGTGVVGGTNVFSGTWNTTTGYSGNFTSASSDDVYSFIGLIPGGNNSNLFGNWHDADLAVNGIDATGFGIFVYSLTDTGITGDSTVDVTFESALDNGTFVVAYGQKPPNGQVSSFTTPITESGLTTHKVPEPGMLLLFGSGLLGLGLFGRGKFRK
jgi:hypothetical protein